MTRKIGRRKIAWIGVGFFLITLAWWLYAQRLLGGLLAPPKESLRARLSLQMAERGEPQPWPAGAALRTLGEYHFRDATDLSRWEQKVFKGGTQYLIEQESGQSYLKCLSNNSSSGLFMKMKYEATPDLFLRWRWRAHEFPTKKEPSRLASRAEDDFAARVYVIFEASNLFHSDVIEYVWDETLPVGTFVDSAYSDRIKLLVIQSGISGEASGGWIEELRNPWEDYQKLFGKKPKNPIGIVALMSDSDNTASHAAADFEEIVVLSKS